MPPQLISPEADIDKHLHLIISLSPCYWENACHRKACHKCRCNYIGIFPAEKTKSEKDSYYKPCSSIKK